MPNSLAVHAVKLYTQQDSAQIHLQHHRNASCFCLVQVLLAQRVFRACTQPKKSDRTRVSWSFSNSAVQIWWEGATDRLIPFCTGTRLSSTGPRWHSAPCLLKGPVMPDAHAACGAAGRDGVIEENGSFKDYPSSDSLLGTCWSQANNCWWLFALAASPEGLKCTSQISHKPVNNWKQHVLCTAQ